MTTERPEPKPALADWRAGFVEELGALGTEVGIPRAMMRVLARMTVCEPAEQSAQQIQAALRLSPAAVSGVTRQLIAAGTIERVSRPSDRRIRCRLVSGSWEAPIRAKLRALGRLCQVAERGLAAAGDQADARLAGLRDSFAYFEDALDRYVSRRQRPKGSTRPE
jgi:DNA-binding MarR family transcriptional regulator